MSDDIDEFLQILISTTLFLVVLLGCAALSGLASTYPDKARLLQMINDIANAIPSLIIGLSTGLACMGFGYWLGRKSSDKDEIQEEARLMIFQKNATQMDKDALWAVVVKHGESSRDGVIAMTELKSRKDLFSEASEPSSTTLEELDATYNGPANHWKEG